MTIKLYQLYETLMIYITHPSIKAFMALARFLVLLLLRNFWYKHNAEGNFSPFRCVIGKKCWHFSDVVDSRFRIQDAQLFLKIHLPKSPLRAILTSFWNLWPSAIVSFQDSRRQGQTVKELIFLHFSKEHKGVIYLNV